MKRLILNDLSVIRSVTNIDSLNHQLLGIVRLVASVKGAREIVGCSRNLVNNIVFDTKTLLSHVHERFPRDSRNQILAWLTNHGPFWDDARALVEFDSFVFAGIDVTEQGLGEVGRLTSLGVDAWSYSFELSDINFSKDTILISHSLEELVVGEYLAPNLYRVEAAVEKIKSLTPIYQSWEAMLERAVQEFEGLIFLDKPHLDLVATPFSQGAALRLFVLLSVLDKIAQSTNDDGSLTDIGKTVFEVNFVGEKPLFTDESDTNKREFKKDLTFRDREGINVFAPWHGKVNTPKLRVHYEWPRPEGQKRIKVLYLGPKLTKR